MTSFSLWRDSLSDSILKTDYAHANWWNLMKLVHLQRGIQKQDTQCTYKVTLKRFRSTIVAVEKQ